jgi:hypothetical protein
MSCEWQNDVWDSRFLGQTEAGSEIDKPKVRHAVRMAEREGPGDGAPHVVPDQTSPRNAEHVHHREKSIGVRTNSNVPVGWRVASSESQKVEDDDPMAGGQQRDHIDPEVPGRWEAVDEHHGDACAACSGGVVVDARA